MTISEYKKLLYYVQHPGIEACGEAEIFAYRINNNILLTTNKFNTKITLYVYEYFEIYKKYIIYMIPFDSIKDLFNQLKHIDKSGFLRKYFRSVGLSQKKNKLHKTKGTINYEKVTNFSV